MYRHKLCTECRFWNKWLEFKVCTQSQGRNSLNMLNMLNMLNRLKMTIFTQNPWNSGGFWEFWDFEHVQSSGWGAPFGAKSRGDSPRVSPQPRAAQFRNPRPNSEHVESAKNRVFFPENYAPAQRLLESKCLIILRFVRLFSRVFCFFFQNPFLPYFISRFQVRFRSVWKK